MARPPSREPNGRTCWFGAELDPDGDQVWFRLDDAAIARMPEKTPAAPRRAPHRRPHRLDHAGPSARARHQPLRGAGLGRRRDMDRTPAVMKMDPPVPTRPAAVALESPAPAARLVEASVSPNTRRAYLRGAAAPRRLARGPASRRRDARRLPRRAPRAGESPVERVDGGGRGALPGSSRRRAEPGRRTDRPAAGGLPADRRRPRPRPGAPLRGGGLGCGPRHLPPTAAPRPRRRVRRRRREARPARRGDRGAALHGGDAAERGERPPLGRCRRGGRRRRGAGDGPPRGRRTHRARRGTCGS